MTIPSMSSLFEEQLQAGGGGGGSVQEAKPEPPNLDELLFKVDAGQANSQEINFLLKHNFITMEYLNNLPYYKNVNNNSQPNIQPNITHVPIPRTAPSNTVEQMKTPSYVTPQMISNDVYTQLEEQKAIIEFLKIKLEIAERQISNHSDELENAYKKEIVDLILNRMNEKTFAAIGFDIINQREKKESENEVEKEDNE